MNIEDVINEDTPEYIALDALEKLNGEAEDRPEEE